MTRGDLVKVDQAQALATKPDGEPAGEAFVPLLVREAPYVDHVLVRIRDPVLPHPVPRVQIQLDPAVAVRGGRRQDLDDQVGSAKHLLLADDLLGIFDQRGGALRDPVDAPSQPLPPVEERHPPADADSQGRASDRVESARPAPMVMSSRSLGRPPGIATG